jgi:GT2 family glycosyltransferase
MLGLGRRDEWRARRVDWILGAVLAIRREAFDAVGGFDEAYFLYQEEVDLCYRLRAAGWEIHYAPVATVLHVGGASTSQRAAETFGQYVRSTQRFARLRLSRSRAAGVRVVLAAVLVARLAREGAQLAWARDRERREHLRGRIAAWRRGLAALRERG